MIILVNFIIFLFRSYGLYLCFQTSAPDANKPTVPPPSGVAVNNDTHTIIEKITNVTVKV
jgi:hypothetical protein